MLDFAGTFFSGLRTKQEPTKEVDPYFDEQKEYISGLKNCLSNLSGLLEERSVVLRDTVDLLLAVSHGSGQIETVEGSQDTLLSSLWNKFSQIVKSIAAVQVNLIQVESKYLHDSVKEYIGITSSAELVLSKRFQVIERIQEAKQKNSLSDAEKLENVLAQMSNNIVGEFSSFNQRKETQMRHVLKALCRVNIDQQQKIVSLWKILLNHLEDEEI
eukprot:TRINITY_DN2115_c0_g1_i1.p1 TRINITY_DN2115_c0_g1~~TRINITY_DN2115_c0_g1_i1.p1  ORF type:complete len:215 (-),score=51.13 TRINITY_DN2115_c0_g1_i1:204-848(-)